MRIIKKAVAALLAAGIIWSGMSAFAAAQTIEINGKITEIPAEMGQIQEKDDRTFVPVRFVMENLGCKVDYIDENKMAVISSISCSYLIQEGNPILFILEDQYTETQNLQMDTSAYIEEVDIDGQSYGRMYVPIRFLAEAIGYTVGWDEATQTVTLSMAS